MFCEVAETSKGVMFRGGKKVWFSDRLPSAAQPAEEPLVSGEA